MSDIAINPVTRRVQFTGNTGTGPFAFTFNVLNSGDIEVYKNTTLLTLTSDYTVSIASNGTGSVTLQAGQAVVSADYLTIIGGRDLERTTDFVTAGDLLASSLNEQLDSNVIMSQQLDESFGRSVSVSPGDVDVSMTLPVASSRASQVLAFTSTGAVTTTNLNDLPELTVDKLNVDNLTLDGNTISTTNTNGNLILTPNGTGDVVVSGDLVVNGTTTTIHSTVVDIADKNITIAYGSADAAAANGAGITVAGADATMNYYSTPDGWEFNKAVTVGYTGVTPQDLGGVLNVYSSSSSVPGMVIKSTASVDPKIQFEYLSQIWTVGQDSSSDDFKIINGTNLNSSAEIHINTDGDVALGGVSHYSNYELSVPQRVAIRSGSAVAGIDFASPTEFVFDGNVGNTNTNFSKFRFVSWEADKMVIDGTTLKAHAFASISGTGVSITDDLKFGDDKKAVFGDSTDLSVYFDAAANKSYISHTGSGSFPVLEFNTDGYDMRFLGGGYFMIRATPGADVKLYHAGSPKLETSASGVVITGSITADSYNLPGVLSLADGSNSAPSLTNTGDTNTGLYFPAADEVGITAGGTQRLKVDSTGIDVTGAITSTGIDVTGAITSSGNILISRSNTHSDGYALQVDKQVINSIGISTYFLTNAYYNSGYKYISNGAAMRLDVGGGSYIFRTAASNSSGADATVTSWTTRATIDSTGIDVTGTVTMDGGSTSADFTFGDNDKAIFGAGSGLQIYHNSSNGNSYIHEAGSGDLLLQGVDVKLRSSDDGANMLHAVENGSVAIYYNGDEKLATSATGIDVTGTVTADAIDITESTNARLSSSDAISEVGSGTFALQATNAAGSALKPLGFRAEDIRFATGSSERMRISSSGDVFIGPSDAGTTQRLFLGSPSNTTGLAGFLWSQDDRVSLGLQIRTDNTFTGSYPITFSTTGSSDMTLDSSGNLLVGQTVGNVYNQSSVSGLKLDGANGNIQTARANNESLLLNRYGSDGDIAKFYKDGAPVGSIGTGSGLLTIGTGTGNLLFENALVAPCSTSALGASNGVVDLGAGTRRFKDLHLSGGVVFGDAGGSGTSTSNTLDSYEEGTFTVSFTGATISLFTDTASYTKVGDKVTWSFYSAASNLTSSSGNAVLTGLPFTVRNVDAGYVPFVTSHNTFFGGSATAGVMGYHSKGNTTCVFVITGGTTSATFVDGTGKYLMATGTYFTDS